MGVALWPHYAFAERFFSSDAIKCAETLQKLISTRKEHGTRQQVGPLVVTPTYRIEVVLYSGSECPVLLTS